MKKKTSKTDTDPIVRVRGGRKGVRHIRMSEWRKEIADAKRKIQ